MIDQSNRQNRALANAYAAAAAAANVSTIGPQSVMSATPDPMMSVAGNAGLLSGGGGYPTSSSPYCSSNAGVVGSSMGIVDPSSFNYNPYLSNGGNGVDLAAYGYASYAAAQLGLARNTTNGGRIANCANTMLMPQGNPAATEM